MIRVFTIKTGGECVPGIKLTNGSIRLGVRLSDGAAMNVEIDANAQVREGVLVAQGQVANGAMVLLHDQAGAYGSWHLRDVMADAFWDEIAAAEILSNPLDRILVTERARSKYPAREASGWVEFERVDRILASERVRAVHTSRAAEGWIEFGRGVEAPVLENARTETTLYGYLPEKRAFEIERQGAVGRSAAVLRVECLGGEVRVSDPLASARQRRTNGV